jgi:hypothetical protein
MYPLQPLGPDYPAHFWNNLAKYSAKDLSDAHLAVFWSLADFRGGPEYPAHFWKYPAKYPVMNLSDAHLAIFWSLADFRGTGISGPLLEIFGQISGHESE